MHKNSAWLCFLAFLILATTYYTAVAVHSLRDYCLQTHTATPLFIEWSYKEVGIDAFAPVADFTFYVDDNLVRGKTLLSEPLFRNEYAAEQVLRDMKNKQWKIWYAPHHLEHSTLEKRFPWKESLSAIVVLGLFFYFVYLGFYVGRRFG